MVFRRFENYLAILPLALAGLFFSISPAWAGPMKLKIADGKTIEVPYYWVEENEVRFDIAGGVAGIPRSQVVSVEEVLDSREFDPEVILQSAESFPADQQQYFREHILSAIPGPNCETTNTQQALDRFRAAAAPPAEKTVPVQTPKYFIQKTLPEVCNLAGGPSLFLQDIVGVKGEAKAPQFSLVLYDAEGTVLSRTACEVFPLSLNKNDQNKLKLSGKLYLVRAEVKPNPSIKRYEILAR